LFLGDAVGGTSEAGEIRFLNKSPPRAEGEKGLPLRAETDAKRIGHVGGGSPASGPGSPLLSMVATSSSPPPGGLARLRAWLATDGHGNGIFLAAARGLALVRAWLFADGHGGGVLFAAAGGLAHLRAWLAAHGHGHEGGCNREHRVGPEIRGRV
jgi:hypothetical protein